MKKILAILLALVLTVGIGAIAASAVDVDAVPMETSISVGKGFAKNGAKYFMNLKELDPTLSFSAPENSQFTINPVTGKMTFKTGPASLIPVNVTVTFDDGSTLVVKVSTYYEFYEYLVIIFAAGIFWIAAVNN